MRPAILTVGTRGYRAMAGEIIAWADATETWAACGIPQDVGEGAHFLDALPWPLPTLLRYHWYAVVLAANPWITHVLALDADLRILGELDPATLFSDRGLTAVEHPGYSGTLAYQAKPFESDPHSAAFVAPQHQGPYYAGAVVGGPRQAFLALCHAMVQRIDADLARGTIATWHDESYLNACLALHGTPPVVALPASYCAPEGQETVYPHAFPAKILARTKDHAAVRRQNGGR